MEGERILKELLKKKLGGLYDDTKVIYEELVIGMFDHILFLDENIITKDL